ncbi:MAG TPA: SRPBCC family protein [Acidimicrobiia bacterium]|nr:SRPBCC family protein [Acidimicrobiia bacterium]
MRIEASTTIACPVAEVWEFYAVNHVANHPRWDPSIELEATSDGPIDVGTVIKRRVNRFGKVTEGTMEVVEFEPEAAMRVRTQDGPMTIDGWALFHADGDQATELTIGGEIPGIDDSIADQIRTMMERSASNIKALIESGV